jgi:Ras-related protein Rab-23
MLEEDMEVSLKVIIVGNGRVGKTTMLTKFAKGAMTEDYKKTIGTDFMEKEITLPSSGETVRLMLWDTAGQEMFSKLTRAYYRGAGAVVYVFSTIDRESFDALEDWKDKVEAECPDIVSVLVQNKVDLIEEAKMTSQEVEDLASSWDMKLYRTSVARNLHVNEVFDDVAQQFIKKGGEATLESGQALGRQGAPKSKSAFGGSKAKGKDQEQGSISLQQLKPTTRRTGGKKGVCNW